MKRIHFGLLPKIIIAIGLGVVCGLFFPDWLVRIFLTVNSLFGNFLGFIIPLLILGLVAPGIADLGKGAGQAVDYGVVGLLLYSVFRLFYLFYLRLGFPLAVGFYRQALFSFGGVSQGAGGLFYDRDAAFDGGDDLFGTCVYLGTGDVGDSGKSLERHDGGFQGYY